MSKSKITLLTATNIVIANMIGTGVFTSLHFQAMDIKSGYNILLLWLIGGIAALTGALVYAEVGARLTRSGGEYNYLSRIYHPSFGFISGWVSITVGFAAPVAAAAIALGSYVNGVFPDANTTLIATASVIALTALHTISIQSGSNTQNIFTIIKIAVILLFIISGILIDGNGDMMVNTEPDSYLELFSPAFAVSLFFVSYSYSGWNASAYLAGEINNAKVNLPRSLFTGTAIVTILYLLLNYIFMKSCSGAELKDNFDVGHIAASNLFNSKIGNAMGLIVALLLVSSISSMVFAGPRVAKVMGEDYLIIRFFSKENNNGVPYVAILFQCAVSVFFILTSTFESVITYLGFTLNLFTFFTVLGIFFLRKKDKAYNGYKTWGYPVTPVVFLIISSWILYFGFTYKTFESLAGLLTAASGLLIYYLNKIISSNNSNA